MNAPTIPRSPHTRRELATGSIVSLLLHALAVALLFVNLRLDMTPAPPKETTIEVLIVEEKKKDTPPQPSQEQTKQAEAAIPDLPVMAERPPPPQLQTAAPAERSEPPPGPARARVPLREGQGSRGPAPTPAPPAPPAPPAAKAELSLGGGANQVASLPRGGGEGPAKQDEKDHLLAQVLPFWLLNYRDPRYQHVVFRGYFTLRADGMLEPPFGKDDPWDPGVMIGDYDRLKARQLEPQRVALESFLKAVRAAQPFKLQPGVDPMSYPRQVAVFFRLGDL